MNIDFSKTGFTPSTRTISSSSFNRSRSIKKTSIAKFLGTIFLGYLLVLFIFYVFGNKVLRSTISVLAYGNKSPVVFSYKTYTIMMANGISPTLKEQLVKKLEELSYDGTKRFNFVNDSNADIIISVDKSVDEGEVQLFSSYLVPVGHLYWIKDDIKSSNLSSGKIYSSERTIDTVKALFPENQSITSQANVLSSLKSSENTFALLDINELDARYKLLELDDLYFLDNPEKGGIPYYIVLKTKKDSSFITDLIRFKTTDMFKEKITKDQVLSLTMTGVTAISRSLAMKINASGRMGYPAEKISSFLKKADLTHTSNEVSFVDGCTPKASMSFCANPKYIQALKDSGIDIVELTGNHNNDYGSKWNTSTINTYKKQGWDYFGGGLNSTDAAKILYKDVKGTKIAFLGYNYYDSMFQSAALAGSSRAGANSYSRSKVKRNIEEAKKNADIVIVTFQYQECWAYTTGNTICYGAISSPNQKSDFKYAIDMGADIVVGTQAHQPQTYEIYKNKLIFYGLGNLFFDQTPWLGTRQGIILTHYFIDGKFVQTKVTTTIYDADMRTYVTTGSQRTTLLKSLRNAR